MGKNHKQEGLTGDQGALLKIADDIYDSGLEDGYAEGVKTAVKKEKIREFLARLLEENREYKEKTKQSFNEEAEKTHIAACILAEACGWNGMWIVRAFCDALTDANFHRERKALALEINKLFGTDIAREG